MDKRVLPAVYEILEHCKKENFQSYDLFDALDSPIAKFINNPLLNRIFLQLLSKAPFNARALLGIKKTDNPKILSDILSTLCNLKKAGITQDIINEKEIIEKLLKLKSKNSDYCSWGVPFKFVSRNGTIEKETPNSITTYYALSSLMDYYEMSKDEEILSFVYKNTGYFYDEAGYITSGKNLYFCYYKNNERPIHNSNMLVSSLLGRIGKIKNDSNLMDLSYKGMSYSCSKQNDDGSWYYGELPDLKWIDNFHTAYILEALFNYKKGTGVTEFDSYFKKGYDYYITNFFTESLIPKYYNNSLYPIDAQTIGESLQLLSMAGGKEDRTGALISGLIELAFNDFYNKGHFYFRQNKGFKNKLSYLRWSTTPILLAFSYYLSAGGNE
ncbi:MAG: hypothetical protein P4L27_01470 [Ignavibacteriaceae bacterium]|nr:hypothetical protein [Ignavibacteriaceae bacterium]